MDKPLSTSNSQQLSLRGLRPEQQLGEVLPAIHLVRTSWIVRLIGKITLALLVVSLVAMFTLPWQQTSRGQGTVVALNPQQRPQVVGSQQDGIVKQVRRDLREGVFVHKDDVILEIEPFAPDEVNQVRGQIAQLELMIAASKTSLRVAEEIIEQRANSGMAQISEGEREVDAARQKWEQTQKEVDVLSAELTQKTYEWDQAQALYPKGLVSELEYKEKSNGWQQAQAKLKKGRSKSTKPSTCSTLKRTASNRNAGSGHQERRSPAKAQDERQKLAKTEKELSDLQIKLGSLGRLTITSPVDGTLHQIEGIEGSSTVKKGDALSLSYRKLRNSLCCSA